LEPSKVSFVGLTFVFRHFGSAAMSVLDDFVRMRLYRDRAAEFNLLADTEPLSQVRLRYRLIAQHYKALADREERADKARLAEGLERLKRQRERKAAWAISSITLVAAE
jgi:hypothetical protein